MLLELVILNYLNGLLQKEEIQQLKIQLYYGMVKQLYHMQQLQVTLKW
jgi:hypothetical protein